MLSNPLLQIYFSSVLSAANLRVAHEVGWPMDAEKNNISRALLWLWWISPTEQCLPSPLLKQPADTTSDPAAMQAFEPVPERYEATENH